MILAPFRSDGGRREELWGFIRRWLQKHHPEWPIYQGRSPDGPFNRGAAINEAARRAGNWDVAVVSDTDNICDPAVLREAVCRAHRFDGCVFPYETYMYLDERSSNNLVTKGNWFVSPIPQRWGMSRGVHCSGVQAISRRAYDTVGGFPEMTGWGHEDMVMAAMLRTFTSHIEYLPGAAYHLYHGEEHEKPERQKYGETNRQILADVLALSVLPDQLRAYLQAGGHPIP